MSGKSSSFAWTADMVSELVSLYEEHECLWNYHTEAYKNRMKRDQAIRTICSTLSITKEQLVKKIHNLRNQYNFELKKQHKRSMEGDGTGPTVKWEYFDRLSFLKRYISHRAGYGNQTITIPMSPTTSDQTNIECETECQTLDTPYREQPETGPVKQTVPKFEYQITNVTSQTISNADNVDVQMDLNLVVEEDHPYVEHHEPNRKAENQPEHLTIVHSTQKISRSNIETAAPATPASSVVVEEPAEKRARVCRDECDTFGEFVAHELRNMRNDFSRKKMKRKIMQAMLEVWNEDDEVNINICLN